VGNTVVMRRRWEAPFAARAAVAGSTAVLVVAFLAVTGLIAITPLLGLLVPSTFAGELGFEALWRRQPSDDEYPS
jgi:hypothetical protein